MNISLDLALLVLAHIVASFADDVDDSIAAPPVVAVGSLRGWHCSGIALDRWHVLTARHCLPATRVGQGSSVSDLSEVDVKDVRLGPNGLDVALLTTESPLSPTKELIVGDLSVTGKVHAWGFGRHRHTDGRFTVGLRHQVDLSNGMMSRCDAALANVTGCRRGELVIQGSGTVDTCNGDSGGPVMQRVDGRETWIGVVSRAVGTATLRCGDGGIYVSSWALRNWLLDNIEEEK